MLLHLDPCVRRGHVAGVAPAVEFVARKEVIRAWAGRWPVPMSLLSAITCTVLYAQHPEHAPCEYRGPISIFCLQSKVLGRSMSFGSAFFMAPSREAERGLDTATVVDCDSRSELMALRRSSSMSASLICIFTP